MKIAKVIVDLPLMQTDKPFSYAISKEFKAVKNTLRALEEIADGTVKIHPSPELKRETLVEKRELERLQAKMKEQLIKEQIAKEEAEEEAKQKNSRAAKAAAAE